MASQRKTVGKIKLPAAFAELGLSIDPSRLKPNAWQNRDKGTLKTKSPSIMESRQEPIEQLYVEAEICHVKPSINKGVRRKRSNRRAQIPSDDIKRGQKKPSIPIPTEYLHEFEFNEQININNDTETSNDDHEEIKHISDGSESIICSQLQLIEQLQTEKLILEEWKTEECGTVDKLTQQNQLIQHQSQQYQLQIEGLSTKNDALNQQITAYQDEIEKLEKEKIGKMQTQINELEHLLSEHNMISEQLQSKEEELSVLKMEFEMNKSCLFNNEYELKTLRKENEEIKRENFQYLELLDKLKEEEVKLKKTVNEQQLEITEIASKYAEIENKLTKETVETREQLVVATHFANNLSDQLEEIHNFRAKDNHHATDSESSDGIGFGRPLFEKRKTLKILTYEQSLKLPNMMDMIDMINNDDEYDVDDEFIDFNSNSNKPLFAATLQGKSLPPVNEFDVNDDKINEFQDEEDEKSQIMKDTNQSSFAAYISRNIEEDKIDKLLRKISGSSYHKFRRGSSSMVLDVETRNRLKNEIVAYIGEINIEYEKEAQEKDAIIIRYKEESKEWEDKYKGLKREIKKKRLKNAQNIQKLQEPVVGGCKFWSWGTIGSGFSQKWFDLQKGWTANVGTVENPKTIRIFVADDSDDTDSNSNTNPNV